ncbi:MAG: hypothetical protein JOZ77_04975 [Candidatus Eremiobacteraeota bacterium]|nr:hypothetical protein [Candidatus Eremiobacteraeota bacterium]
MIGLTGHRYNGFVYGGWWRGALVTLAASMCCLAYAAPVRADEQLDVGASPVLNVNVTRGQVTIQTWDRPQIEISSENQADVRHFPPSDVDPGIPKQMQMPSHEIQTEHGPVTLPAESFVLPELPGGPHDAVVVRGAGRMTIMIPRATAMVIAHLRAGHLNLTNYHGVFVTHVRSAEIFLDHVGGTGYVESLRGGIVAIDSTFDRLRARTASGSMFFQRCTSHQIQATSTYGSIVYDNGDFQAGLARFESEHGNVALGVRGSAQIGAHSGAGHVISSFDDGAQVRGDPTTQQATVRGGGPVVTATSKNGSVYLYSGSMNEHPHVRQELSGSTQLPMRPRSEPPPQPDRPPA